MFTEAKVSSFVGVCPNDLHGVHSTVAEPPVFEKENRWSHSLQGSKFAVENQTTLSLSRSSRIIQDYVKCTFYMCLEKKGFPGFYRCNTFSVIVEVDVELNLDQDDVLPNSVGSK